MIPPTPNLPQKCECGRLYKCHTDKDGKTMCPACYTGFEVEELKKLWETPIPEYGAKAFLNYDLWKQQNEQPK